MTYKMAQYQHAATTRHQFVKTEKADLRYSTARIAVHPQSTYGLQNSQQLPGKQVVKRIWCGACKQQNLFKLQEDILVVNQCGQIVLLAEAAQLSSLCERHMSARREAAGAPSGKCVIDNQLE